jgi:dolichyl-phosphate beta-glucosyltransferase
MENKILQSIVIPAYAEENFIKGTLDSLEAYLRSNNWLDSTEVIVVTADAPDKTVDIVKESIKVFPHNQHILPGARVGKGRDVKAGLAAAKGKYVLFMDADMATPLNYIKDAFEKLDGGSDMAIGVRQINKMHKTLIRRTSSLLSNSIIRAFIGWNISDSQCGFKAFQQEALKVILPRSEIMGWGFDFEFIKIAKIHELKISTIAVPDWKDPKPEGTGLAGDSQLSAMKKTLKELLRVKRKQLSGDYK